MADRGRNPAGEAVVAGLAPEPQRTLGQAAYEKYVVLFGSLAAPKRPWEQLRPPDKARRETIATAVLEACGGSDG